MSKIIVSYRRSDSQAIAGRIVDRLTDHFGPDAVFMDVDSIPFGVDFRDHIHSVLSQSDVLLAIVGPNWLGTDAKRHRRIDDEDDPVRVEIETALTQKLLVIPVLVNDAKMPKASTLPDALHNFSFLNAAPIDAGRDFRPHVDRLIRSIEKAWTLQSTSSEVAHAKTSAPANSGTSATFAARRLPVNSMVAAAAILLILIGGVAWRFGIWSSPGTSAASHLASAPPTSGPAAAPANPTNMPEKDTATAPPSINPIATAPDSNDDSDWKVAQNANTYETYLSYAKHHPQGQHISDARRAAIAGALKTEPPIGGLPTGETVLVDDRICDVDQIDAVTGGDVTRGISRTKKCVSRDQPF